MITRSNMMLQLRIISDFPHNLHVLVMACRSEIYAGKTMISMHDIMDRMNESSGV